MGKRKLASVQYVHHITPIVGAGRIECVHVLGWKCVANKGQFRVGDCCVYMEADSFLPICEQFEFLRSSSYEKNELLGEGFRLRTMKFRGQLYLYCRNERIRLVMRLQSCLESESGK